MFASFTGSLGLWVESAAPVDKNEQFACFSTMSIMMMMMVVVVVMMMLMRITMTMLKVSDHMGLPNLTHNSKTNK